MDTPIIHIERQAYIQSYHVLTPIQSLLIAVMMIMIYQITVFQPLLQPKQKET